ncbi:hypothetical protein [Methanobacterium formicicum]|nr:hypothetical protein [Methanobacterium formicicum]
MEVGKIYEILKILYEEKKDLKNPPQYLGTLYRVLELETAVKC